MRGLSQTPRPLLDSFQNKARNPLERSIVEPQHLEPGVSEPLVAACVGAFTEPMNATVQLDHEPQFRAQEIDDEPGHGCLSAEFQPVDSPAAQQTPENRLGSGHF